MIPLIKYENFNKYNYLFTFKYIYIVNNFSK